MEEKVIKIRCPHCAGKIAIDEDIYDEFAEKVIHCPHCNEEMIVPKVPMTQKISPHTTLENIAKATMNLKPIIDIALESEDIDSGTRRCPHCGAEVGKKDRVCLSCEGKLI